MTIIKCRFQVGLIVTFLFCLGSQYGCDDYSSETMDLPSSDFGFLSDMEVDERRQRGGGNDEGVMNDGGALSGSEEEGGEWGSGELVLAINPREVSLTWRGNESPPTQNFSLTVISDRGEIPLPAEEATWTVEPSSLGSFQAGRFISSGQNGSGQVFAEFTPAGRDDLLITSARVSVSRSEDMVGEGVSSDDVAAFTEASPSSSCNPITFIYPEAFTTIPVNLKGFSFQWNDADQLGPYLLTGTAGNREQRWFTLNNQVTPEGLPWESIKVNGIGEGSQWRLSYLTASGERCDSPALTLLIDRSELSGAIYYWSTTDGGIMRLPANETAPEPFLTPQTAPEITCPACHALSRDGTRIAFTRTTFPPFGDLATSATLDPRNLYYDPMGVEGYFPSFSPDPDVLVAGSSGRLVILNSNQGNELGELPLPSGMVGGSPDWSWQGDRIVATLGPAGIVNPLPNAGINQGSIYEWVKSGGTWNTPTELVAPMGNRWNTQPAYSPDGRFVVFNVNGENPTSSDESMGNPNVELWVKWVGEDTPAVRLNRANYGELQGNSWPKWSPHDRRGKLWLAFSSTRDYGHQLIQNDGSPTPQIWITAIDPDTPTGQDPSSPAFWLPYQSLNSGNHIPYWAPYEKR